MRWNLEGNLWKFNKNDKIVGNFIWVLLKKNSHSDAGNLSKQRPNSHL